MEELNKQKPVYTISTTADLLGISIHTLRMYEREGLILPHKKKSGHRLYSEQDIARIKCIRKSINESKISIAGIKALYSLLPCWKLVNCSESERQDCPAFAGDLQPCWTFKQRNNLCKSRECRECVVYTNFGECDSIKKAIHKL